MDTKKREEIVFRFLTEADLKCAGNNENDLLFHLVFLSPFKIYPYLMNMKIDYFV